MKAATCEGHHHGPDSSCGFHDHSSDNDHKTCGSPTDNLPPVFTYYARKPFDPVKLYQFVTTHFELRQEPYWEDEEEYEGGHCMEGNIESSFVLAKNSVDSLYNEAFRADELIQKCETLTHRPELLSALENVRKAVVELKKIFSMPSNENKTSEKNAERKKSLRFGNVEHSEGTVWIATRPTIEGSWHQKKGTVWLTWEGPWQSLLPNDVTTEIISCSMDTIYEDQEQSDGKIAQVNSPTNDSTKDEQRQEIHFWGKGISEKELETALNGCLIVEDCEIDPQNDPFDPWPSIEELAAAGNDDALLALQDVSGSDTNTPASHYAILNEQHDKKTPFGCILHVKDGASEVQGILDDIPLGKLLLIHWYGPWANPSKEASQKLEVLARKYFTVPIIQVDVEASYANRVFALEKTMARAASARPDAKLVLKDSNRWPCFTLHRAPYLQPAEMQLTGEDSLRDIEKILLEETDLQKEPLSAPFEDLKSESQVEYLVKDVEKLSFRHEPIQQAFQLFRGGPGELKVILKDGREKDKAVVLVWIDSSKSDSSSEVYCTSIMNSAALSLQAKGLMDQVILVLADVSASQPTEMLAKGLKVLRFPTVDRYKAMKMEKRVVCDNDDPRKTFNEALITDLADCTTEPTSDNATNGEMSAESGKPKERSVYDPPTGKYAKPGFIKKLSSGGEAHFFPKMPCLRCGCPWWTSDEWHGKCIRCGWDCERSGYDDDSQPLPPYRNIWKEFTNCIKEGKTYPWTGNAKGSSKS